MSSDPGANAYLATRILTATPEQLRMMLLEGAVKFAKQGRDGMVAKNYEAVFNGFTRCRAILVELVSTMKPEPDAELYARLSALYLFMMSRLLESSHERSVPKAEEVIKLLEYERETWSMLIEKVARMRKSGELPAAAGSKPAASAPLAAGARPTMPSLSVAG